jgi:dTDP-4-amino-4,6-dideoxy-D-galactose acyltransferase
MEMLEARKKELYFYSPYNFVRAFDYEAQLENCVYSVIRDFHTQKNNRIIEIDVKGHKHEFLISFLPWDTNYFNINTYKLLYALYQHRDLKILTEAVQLFMKELFKEKVYCFIEIPSEDIQLIQALGSCGYQLIETRLTYFRGNLFSYNHQRYPVRKADEEDALNLMRVAREMRNDFDRFHADDIFDKQIADEFLATYIEQSLRGFSDVVLTPNEPGLSSDSFLTAKYLKSEWDTNKIKISKMVLSAVSSKENKGWYKKLISEMTYHLRDEGAEYIFMNTQSTNRAVLHTWGQLGYKVGCTRHVLSYNNYK